jgi:hypothetical protein
MSGVMAMGVLELLKAMTWKRPRRPLSGAIASGIAKGKGGWAPMTAFNPLRSLAAH